MKNNLYIFTTIILVLSSCAKPTEACFDFSPTVITTSTSVTFNATCTRHGGYSYEWNFGDGKPDTTLLGEPTITHTFNSSGTYVVTLKAGRKDGVVWKENNKYITERTLTVQ